MPSIKVTDIIYRAELVLQDENVRWKRLELQNWINESYLSILTLRPDANSVTVSFTCDEGTRQNLEPQFQDSIRLLEIIRNLSPDSKGRAIRLINQKVLDDQIPDWYSEKSNVNIQYYMYDIKRRNQFYVYPSAKKGTQIELNYSQLLEPHNLTEAQLDPSSSSNEVIRLQDTYSIPILDWVLYRCFIKDADYEENGARAGAFYQSFSSAVNVKMQSDISVSPKKGG